MYLQKYNRTLYRFKVANSQILFNLNFPDKERSKNNAKTFKNNFYISLLSWSSVYDSDSDNPFFGK